jgi:hypothetical protein|tara:strand:+ start:144 stop:575 length:432 start_codon:yes stop_codon:yes gene_type:complete
MKLSQIILEGPLEYDPDFNREIDKIQDQGGKYLGSGDYGSVYLLKGKAVKVTTDSIELDHAEKLKGKKTNNFVYIFDVNRLNNKLGIITMEVMGEYKGDIPEDFIDKLEKEAVRFNIDPTELDIRPDNFMVHPKSGKLKMTDV